MIKIVFLILFVIILAMLSIKKPITKLGMTLLQKKLNSLKAQLPIAIDNIQEARRLGDLSENHEYHSAQKHKDYLQRSISQLEEYFSSIQVQDTVENPKFVGFGTKVVLEKNNRDRIDYIILGDYEAEVSRGSITISSPIVQAMINKSVGDLFSVNNNKYVILKILKPSDEEIQNAMADIK